MEGGLCYSHANPDKASELGQRGGKAKGPKVTADPVEYVARPLKTVDDVTKNCPSVRTSLEHLRLQTKESGTRLEPSLQKKTGGKITGLQTESQTRIWSRMPP